MIFGIHLLVWATQMSASEAHYPTFIVMVVDSEMAWWSNPRNMNQVRSVSSIYSTSRNHLQWSSEQAKSATQTSCRRNGTQWHMTADPGALLRCRKNNSRLRRDKHRSKVSSLGTTHSRSPRLMRTRAVKVASHPETLAHLLGLAERIIYSVTWVIQILATLTSKTNHLSSIRSNRFHLRTASVARTEPYSTICGCSVVCIPTLQLSVSIILRRRLVQAVRNIVSFQESPLWLNSPPETQSTRRWKTSWNRRESGSKTSRSESTIRRLIRCSGGTLLACSMIP